MLSCLGDSLISLLIILLILFFALHVRLLTKTSDLLNRLNIFLKLYIGCLVGHFQFN